MLNLLLWVLAHTIISPGGIMSRKYNEYSAGMRKRLSPEGKMALQAFEDSYELGLSLINARRSRELTQKQLAEMTGINQSEISKIETGSLAINTATLFRLLNALDANLRIELKTIRPTNKLKRSLIGV